MMSLSMGLLKPKTLKGNQFMRCVVVRMASSPIRFRHIFLEQEVYVVSKRWPFFLSTTLFFCGVLTYYS